MNITKTKYRLIQECPQFFHDGSPMLYIYPEQYNRYDDAFAAMDNAVRITAGIHNNNPADPHHEFFGYDHKAEVFYWDCQHNKVVTDRWLLNPIEEIDHTDEADYTHYYKYRGVMIQHNDQRNRFYIPAENGKRVVRHSLKNALEYIDRMLLNAS